MFLIDILYFLFCCDYALRMNTDKKSKYKEEDRNRNIKIWKLTPSLSNVVDEINSIDRKSK